MILARPLCLERSADLELAFARLALPRTARDYLLAKLPQQQLLLTGLSKSDGIFLKGLAERSNSPGREDFPFYVPGDQGRRPGTALLTGRREQFDRLVSAARRTPGEEPLAVALQRALDCAIPPSGVELGGRRFEFGQRTYLMGVVNVTPDSFSDGGHFLAPDAAIEHGVRLVQAGVDLLDVGGESTRPGAAPVEPDRELERVLPVIEGLRRHCPNTPISVDTTKAAVAAPALEAGACLVNDISGLTFDPLLASVVARADAALCVMHIQGSPQTMQRQPHYGDVVAEVVAFLDQAMAGAQQAGVDRERIFVDPGIGFGKTLGHNLLLLRRLTDLRLLGAPILVGTSRKSFLGQLTGGKPPAERLAATIGSVVAVAAWGGADVVRVHDVAQVGEALQVVEAIRHAADGGEDYAPAAKLSP